MLNTRKFFLIIFFIIFFLEFPSISESAIIKKEVVNILYVIEKYGAETNPSVKWRLSKNLLTEDIPPLYTIGTNDIKQNSFPNAKEALKTVNDKIVSNLNSYISSIAQYLKDKKFTYAKVDWIYSFYDQEDKNTLKKVYLPLIIYSDGKLRNLGARIIIVDPKILYYIYKSKATEDVPVEFGYPDGGVLYKYILDLNFSVISKTQVDTGGRYDAPITPECESDIDPNTGIEMLVQEIIKPEIEQYSNIIAILDYSRPVKPQDDCDEEKGYCESKIYVESLSRTFTIDKCKGANFYRNTGTIIYYLEYVIERYAVERDGNFTLTAKFEKDDMQAKNYDKTVTISGNSVDDFLIIDPFKTEKLYDYRKDSDPTISCKGGKSDRSKCRLDEKLGIYYCPYPLPDNNNDNNDNKYINNLSCDKYVYQNNHCAQAPVVKRICDWVSICDEPCQNSDKCCKSHEGCLCMPITIQGSN